MLGGINRYGYVGANPLTLVDPMGLSAGSMAGCFAKGVGSGAVGGIVAAGAVFAIGAVASPLVATVSIAALAAVGTTLAFYNVFQDVEVGNWDGVAFTVGSFVGGASAGKMFGKGVSMAMGGKGIRYTLAKERADQYNSKFMNPDGTPGSFKQYMSDVPSGAPAGAGIAMAGGGSGGFLARLLTSSCD